MILPKGCVKECRGCFHREYTLEQSINQKTNWLKNIFSQWKDTISCIKFLPYENLLGYRDKVCLSVSWAENRWQFGMLRNDVVIPIHKCPIHNEIIRKTINVLIKNLPPADVFPLTFYIHSGKQVLLVLKTDNLQHNLFNKEFFNKIKLAGNESFWLHFNPCPEIKIYGKQNYKLLWGSKFSRTSEGFYYGPMSFQQLIPELYNDSLKTTLDFFNIMKGDGVVDLYCGLGRSLFEWTRAGASSIGVELNGEAVECARLNLVNTLVLRGKCDERIPQIDEWIEYKEISRLYLYVNPPRTGIHENVLNWILKNAFPEKIAYLSSSVATLQKDLIKLTENGYIVKLIQPYDFFPRTHHVECLVLLTRTK